MYKYYIHIVIHTDYIYLYRSILYTCRYTYWLQISVCSNTIRSIHIVYTYWPLLGLTRAEHFELHVVTKTFAPCLEILGSSASARESSAIRAWKAWTLRLSLWSLPKNIGPADVLSRALISLSVKRLVGPLDHLQGASFSPRNRRRPRLFHCQQEKKKSNFGFRFGCAWQFTVS